MTLGPDRNPKHLSDLDFRQGAVDEGDGRHLVEAMAEEVARLYGGLDLNAAGMPKAGPQELQPPGGIFLVAYIGSQAVGCGGFKRLSKYACEIKRMYVAPRFRGLGIARATLGVLEHEAELRGYRVARLGTGHLQDGARRLYESSGYIPIGNFSGNPVATYFGEKNLSYLERD